MPRISTITGLTIALLLSVLPACLTVESLSSSDPHILHHHNWWNYYERGRLQLREGNTLEAKADFETALGLRAGARYPYPKDSWRVRTYGVHRMESYFPNRELGICLFETGYPAEALPYLETSLKMEPSARAKFYINQVRSRLTSRDNPPQIKLDAPSEWTSERQITIHGIVSGSNPIQKIQINGAPLFFELAEAQISFDQQIALSEGSNCISIVATDLAGQHTETNLLVRADWQPPQLSLKQAAPENGGYRIFVQCTDDASPAVLKINDRELPLTHLDQIVTSHISTDHAVTLSAIDQAGNRVDWRLSGEDLRRTAEQQADIAPPRLHLADAGKTITLCEKEYLLDLRADDDGSLQSIQMNDQCLLTGPGPRVRAHRRIPLDIGTNRFVVAATDTTGKRAEQTITVIRREPEYLDRHYRLAVNLPPLTGELFSETFRRQTELLLEKEITRVPVRFYLLAGKNEADEIRNEQLISSTRLTDPRAALRKGQELHSDLVFNCRVLNDGDGQTIFTQVSDAENGKELFIEDVYVENQSHLQEQISGLILKIEQHFPIVQARIINQREKITIDAGRKTGVWEGARFLVVRSNGSFREGRVVKSDGRPVELKISEVESENAQGIITAQSGVTQPGDYVFTR